MSISIYVGNLAYSTDEDGLSRMFGSFGEVISANVIRDRETGRSRGFGFVEMSPEDGQKAITSLNGQELDGRALKVNEAQKRDDRPRRPPRRF